MNSLIKSFVDKCLSRSPRIGVAGDSMIDSYHQVSVNRLSPEFPIPIYKSDRSYPSQVVPGGAANVARQLGAINCVSGLSSFSDPRLLDILDHYKIRHFDSFYSPEFKIPEKKRYYQDDFPLCRMDIESENYGIGNILSLKSFRDTVLKMYAKKREQDDALILSDYGKGFFSDRQDWCNHPDIITIVDPKRGPIEKWMSCDVFKPNAADAITLSEGRTDRKQQCGFFAGRLGCRYVVVTDGGNGVYGYDADSDAAFFEIKNKHKIIPRSVIGAGDCFSAFLALAIFHGFSIRDASEIAFQAGQVYVTQIHNKPVTLYDLLRSVDPIAAKFLDPPKDNGKLVFANGCFDCLHAGHVEFLKFARSKGDRLIVALNTDDSVKRLKGESRPIRPLKERIEMVANLSCVDYVTSFNEDTPYECMKKYRPNYLSFGEEYWQSAYPLRSEFKEFDFIEKYYPFIKIEGISTTEEIRRIQGS